MEEVIDFQCNLSSLCPISFSKVSTPVRGPDCRHLRFFDKASFAELYRKKGFGPCPICMKPIRISDLIVDTYIQNQLQSQINSEDVISVKQEISLNDNENSTGCFDCNSIGNRTLDESNTIQQYTSDTNSNNNMSSSSLFFTNLFWLKGVEEERHQWRQQSLEAKYLKYVDLYSQIIAEATTFSSSQSVNSPFIVFQNANVQQISAIHEVSDAYSVYSLQIGHDVLVVIEEKNYPSTEEEDGLVCHDILIDDFIISRRNL